MLGTRAGGVAAQIAQVRAHATETLLLPPAQVLGDPAALAARVGDLPAHGTVVVALDPAAPAEPARARDLIEALAAAVAPTSTATTPPSSPAARPPVPSSTCST